MMKGEIEAMKRFQVYVGCLVWLMASHVAGQEPAASAGKTSPRPGRLHHALMLNEDNSHFFGSRKPAEMNLAGLHAWVDRYAGSAVTHLVLCPNAMRASFRSRSRDAIWDPVDGKEPQGLWPQNAKRLFEAGLDPYQVWIARCREKGILPWLSMRMNDVHCVDDAKNFMHSTFWRAHPEYWRVPQGAAASWTNRAMNYAHAAVREHHMALVRELLERYDPDGLELDWMRFGYHLTPGRERAEGVILTAFVREVRGLTDQWSKKRGHAILLSVRAPADPDVAAGLGMDAVGWAREGLVDLIVPCPFWASSDFDIPVESWRERSAQAADRVAVAPGLEFNSRPWPAGAAVANDLALARGFAASACHRGADNLCLFNWMDSDTRPCSAAEYAQLLREGLWPQATLHAARRHPVCYRDTVLPGTSNGAQLPAAAKAGKTFAIPVGPKPPSGKVWAIACLAKRDGVADARLEASLNGRPLAAAEDASGLKSFGGGAARAVRFACPLDALVDGSNQLHLRQVDGLVDQQIVWVEICMEPK